jgi:hypothetical protein
MSKKYLGGYLVGGTSLTTPASGDPQFNYVTTLLHGDGTNGAQSNTFLDSSTNNLTITNNNNVVQGSVNPFGSLWSNYFDASSGLSIASNTAFNFSGDFTIEGWANVSVKSSAALITRTVGSSNHQFWIGWDSTTLAVFYNGSNVFYPTDSFVAGQWQHYALVRNGSSVVFYINGVNCGSVTNSASWSNSAPVTIGDSGALSGYGLTGYESNVRIVVGTAVYTSNFTPPTTPLTAITNTVLLTCQSNRFLDNSANAFGVSTSQTNVIVSNFSPFTTSTAYSSAAFGGSAYFAGGSTAPYLDPSASLPTITGDFTIEMWVYRAANNGGMFIQFNRDPGNGGGSVYMYSGTTGSVNVGISNNGTTFTTLSFSNVCIQNSWNHVAISRSGSTFRLYVNGVWSGTNGTRSGALYSGFSYNYIGYGDTTYIGYISNLRMILGTALYASDANFTVPTAPLTAVSGTALLLSATNAGVFDSSAVGNIYTGGTAQISTSIYKYGTGSIYFDGSSWLNVANTKKYSLLANFTIEFWAYPTVLSSVYEWVSKEYGLQIYSNGTTWGAAFSDSNNSSYYINFTSSVAAVLNVWQHVAVVRSGNNYYLFVNGALGASATSSSAPSMGTTYSLYIGAFGYGGGNNITGYIDDLRITNGYARYTSAFTAPTAAFPNSYTPAVTTSVVPTGAAAPGIWTLEQQAYYKKQGLWPIPPVQYLVVAGGGGGASRIGGGGGGGGLLTGALSVTTGTTYTVTVGAGGAGGSTSSGTGAANAGSAGSNSVFSIVTATGGGGGAYYNGAGSATSGGSGGGGAAYGANAGASGTSGQGYAGGTGSSGTSYAAGGGGAGAVGGNAVDGTSGGNGGNGAASSITGSSVTYAGGGGGAGDGSSTSNRGSGGTGGGGNGGYGNSGTDETAGNGTTNTGGGGGGYRNSNDSSGHVGGTGGSGVVIISATQAAASTTGSPTVTTSGGNTIYKFTSSGSITF